MQSNMRMVDATARTVGLIDDAMVKIAATSRAMDETQAQTKAALATAVDTAGAFVQLQASMAKNDQLREAGQARAGADVEQFGKVVQWATAQMEQAMSKFLAMAEKQLAASQIAMTRAAIAKPANAVVTDHAPQTQSPREAGHSSSKQVGPAKSWLDIYNLVKNMGLSEEQAKGIADQAFDSQGRYKADLQRSQMTSALDSIDLTSAAKRAAEKIIRANASPGVVAKKPAANDSQDKPDSATKDSAAEKSRSTGGSSGMSTGGGNPATAAHTAGASAGPASMAPNGGIASVVRVEWDRRGYPVDTTTRDGREQLAQLLRDLGRDKLRAA
jgi:hypothetical protein